MKCNKRNRNIQYALSNFECFAKSNEIVFYMNGELLIKLGSFFSAFGPIFYIFGRFFKTKCHFFENGSTTTFLFLLLSKVFDTYQVYYTILLIASELILSLKGYLHYKTITSQNVSPEAQVKNFFVSQKIYVPLSRHSSFCIFNYPKIYKICDVIMSIST